MAGHDRTHDKIMHLISGHRHTVHSLNMELDWQYKDNAYSFSFAVNLNPKRAKATSTIRATQLTTSAPTNLR